MKKFQKVQKKEVIKIQLESKAKLDKDIHEKKEKIEKEIEKELIQAQKEIAELKKNSISDIHNISKEIAANIIENISGDKLNESSIKAAVEEISKKDQNLLFNKASKAIFRSLRGKFLIPASSFTKPVTTSVEFSIKFCRRKNNKKFKITNKLGFKLWLKIRAYECF